MSMDEPQYRHNSTWVGFKLLLVCSFKAIDSALVTYFLLQITRVYRSIINKSLLT